MYRRPYSEVVDEELVPRIPVQPLSYEDAVHFMRSKKFQYFIYCIYDILFITIAVNYRISLLPLVGLDSCQASPTK